MSLTSLASWLQCPNCASPLIGELPLTLRCSSGHSFDTNKRGYVNLLAPQSRMIGDSPAMLDAREGFLNAGHFSPIRQALLEASRIADADADADAEQLSGRPARVVDAGCGTGYYLEGFTRQPRAVTALAMDISPQAVQRAVRAARAHPGSDLSVVDGLIADTWQPLPIRDASADVLFAVFAPRNLSEFHRVLGGGGQLIIVVPSAEHIRQLRESGAALHIPADKAEKLEQDASNFFALSSRNRIEYDVELTPSERASLVGMGPSSHHRTAESSEALDRQAPRSTVTVSVDIMTFDAR